VREHGAGVVSDEAQKLEGGSRRLGHRRYDSPVTDGPSVARTEQAPRSASDEGRNAVARFDDVTWVPLAPNVEERGRLLELDFAALPFVVRRVFMITDVPAGTKRGGHRHRSGAQVLVCISGRIEVDLRRGAARTAVTLTPDTDGLCIPAGIWTAQRYVEEGSALVVLASEPFDPANYETSF
jgi:dTDP-4-dehydrorhamnose 3,5-epimerase-like enzyme